ncbi:transposase [Selenomonas montiformis]|uniref:transposase n=1 Tax=Selenomonas montiformis TaxID=2652285 RepID=UPI003F8973E0
MSTGKRYDNDYKIQAVKLAMEIGQTQAVKELGLSKSAITTWVRSARTGKLDMGDDSIAFTKPLSASERLVILERENKALKKEINELREKNEFLEEASAFFAASRQKYAKRKG